MRRPLNIAHRGGAGLWPENTLFALEQAARSGFDGAEIDVQLTRDGELAVFHDFRLNPELCRDAQGRWLVSRAPNDLPLIRELGHAQLPAFDVGRAKPGSKYARAHGRVTWRDGERIPLLGQAIETVRAIKPDFRLFIEIKTSYADRSLSRAPQEVAEAVIEQLRRDRSIGNAVLVGFDWPALIHARAVEPSLPCWFTTMPRPAADGPQEWAGGFDPEKFGGSIPAAISAANGQGWFCSSRQANARAISQARGCGLFFGVWTVNEKKKLRELFELGADVIVTNRPDRLAAVESELFA